MPDNGERREITRFVNAKEAETVKEAAALVAKTKQQSATAARAGRSRKRRNASPAVSPALEEKQGQQASEKMVDEGDPIATPVKKPR